MFSAGIPGPANLHERWYLRRHRRPMVPAPSNTPLPESMKDAQGKARLYLVYMRPWTLLSEWSSPHVPHLRDLDVLPQAATQPPRKRLRAKAEVAAPLHRSFYASWRWYIRGKVVSQHAQRIIVQFMAANGGRSQSDSGPDDAACTSVDASALPSNDLSLERIHGIMDRMPQKEKEDAAVAEETSPHNPSDFPDDHCLPKKTTRKQRAPLTS